MYKRGKTAKTKSKETFKQTQNKKARGEKKKNQDRVFFKAGR